MQRDEIVKFKRQFASLFILPIIFVSVIVLNIKTESESAPYDLMIDGLVEHPMNFSYSELQSFPMVSEVVQLKCIGGFTEVYNWTGIPVFFLLSTTGIKGNATKVVFYAKDGFSSDLTIEKVMHPTTILALKANGTVLSDNNGYPYRLVVPCKYGYKWVRWITKIEVVDYDYKGTYESIGFSDEADIPSCSLPLTTPPFETFNIVLGNANYSIITLSNSTIDSFDFDAFGAQILINITGPLGTTGYCYIAIPKRILWCDNTEQWQVKADKTLIVDRKVIEDANRTYIYFTYNHSFQEIQIKGVHAPLEFLTETPSGGERVYIEYN